MLTKYKYSTSSASFPICFLTSLLLLLTIFTTPLAHSFYQSPEGKQPESILERFYGFVFYKNQSPDFEDLAEVKNYFDETFYNNLVTTMKISGKNEILEQQLDFMPFIGAQDTAQGFIQKPAQTTNSENIIKIPVAFFLQNKNEKPNPNLLTKEQWSVTVTLTRKNNTSDWKISDFSYKDRSSLNDFVKKSSEYVHNNKIKEDTEGFYRW